MLGLMVTVRFVVAKDVLRRLDANTARLEEIRSDNNYKL